MKPKRASSPHPSLIGSWAPASIGLPSRSSIGWNSRATSAWLLGAASGWLLRGQAELPDGLEWLSESEHEQLSGLVFEKRRNDWLLGRWAAKGALAAVHGSRELAALSEFEVRNDSEGAPSSFLRGRALSEPISISHRDGAALCAIAPAGTLLGCDLERVEARAPAFTSDYFRPEERERIQGEGDPDRAATLFWSAKESALKALGTGLRRDTRELRVELPVETSCARGLGWQPLRVHPDDGEVLSGWWRGLGAWVLTLVCQPVSGPPVALPRSGRQPRPKARPIRDTASSTLSRELKAEIRK